MPCAAMLLIAASLTIGATGPMPPNPTQTSFRDAGDSAPIYRVVMVSRNVPAINYRTRQEAVVDLAGTPLLPEAGGNAEVGRKKGYLEAEVKVERLAPPSRFGPEFLTYVLWGITPEGRANNLGELQVKDGKGRIKVTTELEAFALVVTAEPYFAVTQPSDVVVLENKVRSDTRARIEVMDAKYELLQRGTYLRPEHAAPARRDGPLDLLQARNAVAIASASGAGEYARESLEKAEKLLREAEAVADHHDRHKTLLPARQAVQAAEDARIIAARRAEEARLAAEREASASREADARLQAERAESATAEAELARARAESERASAERAAAEADAARQGAEREKEELRAKLLAQLQVIFETRETARGLVMSMPDVLFDTDRADLRPEAREKLAKVAGVTISNPGLRIDIEGHADSRASDEHNQQLSERRAQSVLSYLVEQGLPVSALSARGYGETRPIASNDTPEGMQLNRRVELIVSGEVIGIAMATPPPALE